MDLAEWIEIKSVENKMWKITASDKIWLQEGKFNDTNGEDTARTKSPKCPYVNPYVNDVTSLDCEDSGSVLCKRYHHDSQALN